MIYLNEVYAAFLSKVKEDDWANNYTPEDMEWILADWHAILNSAIAYFKFPRCSLNIDDNLGIFID